MDQIEPLIQLDKPILLVGLSANLPPKSVGSAERVRVIQDLTRKFLEIAHEINGRVGSERYAVIENDVIETADPARMNVMVEVQSYSNQPHWCGQYTVSKGCYARFHHQGLPRELGNTVAAIYQHWVPKIPRLFATNLEVIRYPPGYDPTDPSGTFEYLLPVI